MLDRAQSLLLTGLISIGYDDRFLVAPESVAVVGLAKLGFKLVSVIYGTDFSGLPGEQTQPYGTISTGPDGTTYVAIRGTDGIEEWLEDAFAFPETYPIFPPNVRVHKGFADVYRTLRVGPEIGAKALLDATTALITPKVIVTGHSLGGALSYLLGAHLGYSCSHLETFEAPRVGDANFCNWMDSRVLSHFRHVIMGDVVPHAPPELMRYTHAGVEVDHDPTPLGAIPDDPLKRLSFLHVLGSVQALLGITPSSA